MDFVKHGFERLEGVPASLVNPLDTSGEPLIFDDAFDERDDRTIRRRITIPRCNSGSVAALRGLNTSNMFRRSTFRTNDMIDKINSTLRSMSDI
jgi:hypothetical protein